MSKPEPGFNVNEYWRWRMQEVLAQPGDKLEPPDWLAEEIARRRYLNEQHLAGNDPVPELEDLPNPEAEGPEPDGKEWEQAIVRGQRELDRKYYDPSPSTDETTTAAPEHDGPDIE